MIRNFFLALLSISVVWGCSQPTNPSPGANWNSFILAPGTTPSNTLPATLPSAASNGTVLDAWQWKFSDIQAQLSNIAAAGYNAVQVSPVEPTKTTSSSMAWYLFYQPCDLTVGNAQLGSEAAFKSLCAAANALGIHIIVDAVLNQTADNGTVGGFDPAVASYIQNNKATWFHNLATVADWTNRYDETQQCLGNGPDWNTQNPAVQSLVLRFLNECVADGASGFRFDAAKSIETSQGADAGQSYTGVTGSPVTLYQYGTATAYGVTGTGNFWDDVLPNLTNSANLFEYGEVIQGAGDNESGYQHYFRTTATNYMSQLSDAIDNKNLTSLTNITASTQGPVAPSNYVAYVENWDDYVGSLYQTSGFSYNKRLLENAIMVARAGLVDIVFARPSEGLWWDPVLVAVNRFRNLMASEGASNEWLAYGGNDLTASGATPNAVLAVRRQTPGGTDKGIVIVNCGAASTVTLGSANGLSLADGTYTDKGPSGAAFTVTSGILTGTVPANTAVVLTP